MLKWLRALWGPRTVAQPERVIFRWFDGEELRAGDPWELYRAFEQTAAADENVVKSADGAGPDANEAQGQIAEAISAVFGVAPYDGKTEKGLTVMERLAICGEFLAFLTEVKKKQEASQTPPDAMDSGSSETPGASPRKPALDLSSTSQESNAGDQPQPLRPSSEQSTEP